MAYHEGMAMNPGTEAARPGDESFRLLVQSVRDYAILMLDSSGRVTSWNEGAERIKGYTGDEIIGRSFTAFYPEEAIASGFPQFELDTATRDGRFEDEGWRVRKDGSRFWANVVITALRDPDGQVVGFAKVTRDLTERRAAEEQARRLAAETAAHAEAARRSEELARANQLLEEQAVELETQAEELVAQRESLQEANESLREALAAGEAAYRELDQFAYVASHDLKAPLRGIANLAQWIQDDAGDQISGESTEHMRLLQGRVRRMEALIDGILAYSRAGRRSGEAAESVDTGRLVREVVELLAPPPSVSIRIPDGLPVVASERIPLQQVFMNLLGNALKYGAAGRDSAIIDVEWRDAGRMVEFTVRDNGPGIAPEFHERIWLIFQTLAARDKVEGTGIGLSMVKKIVESRGGRVRLESAPGQGAAFHFTWPRNFREGVRG